MKSLIITALSVIIVMSSCSVYRSGQTPDDVYFSPAREEQDAYVQSNNDRNDGRRYDNRTYSGYDDYATPDDRWLMMRVRNRSRWSVFDDYNYYNPYDTWGMGGWGGYQPGLSFSYGYNNPYSYSYYNHFNDYYNWNSYYNPYCPQIIVVNPKTNPAGYTKIRNFNINKYSNTAYNNRRPLVGNPHVNNAGNQGYNNANNSSLRNSFRRVFSNSNLNTDTRNTTRETYRAPSQDRPVRVYAPSNNSDNSSYSPRSSGSNSSSGSSSSSSSGGSSSGSRPSRR